MGKKKKRAEAPVPTGHDKRAREKEKEGGIENKAAAPDGVFCSWRLLGTEPYETKFYLYRDGVKVSEEPIAATNYLDAQGTADSEYYVEAQAPNGKTSVSGAVRPLAKPYLEIKTERPDDWKNDRDPKSRPMRYQLGNMSAADLDGYKEHKYL